MYLHWSKCAGDEWCSLEKTDLTAIPDHGVYVIWKPGGFLLRPSTVVRVGSGNIALQLAAHRLDERVMRHGPGLLVTWAKVEDPSVAAGAAAYLAQLLRPLEGEWFLADVASVSVNLPPSA